MSRMLHFPSSLQNGGGGGSNGGVPRRSDSLNATQQKAPTHQIFLTIEQELHDARRVGSHGQEEDLRSALNMVINRVTELSALLSEAYKSQAELELQIGVAKSNLQLVIANNEMLEEALKAGNGRDVGWRRASGAGSSRGDERAHNHNHNANLDSSSASSSSTSSPNPGESPTEGSNSRFFKTFFNGRPGTPTQAAPSHLTSPSLPSLHGPGGEDDALQAALQTARTDAQHARAFAERAKAEADRARGEAAAAARDKAALEAEIEALSQALFEEANRMVASERKRRAEAEGELAALRPLADELKRARVALREEVREARETREELREAVEEKAALRSALRLIEGENVELRSGSSLSLTHGRSGSQASFGGGGAEGGSGSPGSSPGSSPERLTRSRSSSEVGTKSPVHSPDASPTLPTLPPAPHVPTHFPSSPHLSAASTDDDEELMFAPTGLPSSRTLPLDLDARTPLDLDLAHLDLRTREDDSRSSSPACSPPPTALAPAPSDPWAGA